MTDGDFFSRCQAIAFWDLFKSSAHGLSMKSNAIRTSINLPRDLHEATARKGCSARKLIPAGIEGAVAKAKASRRPDDLVLIRR